MARLPELDPDTMSPEQRQVYEDIVSGPRGKVQGPFHAWLRSPDLCGRAQKLGAFCRFRLVAAAASLRTRDPDRRTPRDMPGGSGTSTNRSPGTPVSRTT